MTKNSTLRSNWLKWLLQLAALALIIVLVLCAVDPEKYCPMGGLQALVTYIVNGSLPCSMTTLQIVMGLALAAAVIFLSKLFCGYLCPVGTVEDLLMKARRHLHINEIEIRNGGAARSEERV